MSRSASRTEESMSKQASYRAITDALVNELEGGDVPVWLCPWNRAVSGIPANLATGRTYSGLNVLVLWSAISRVGFATNAWMTLKQANELGGRVRRGERGTRIIGYFDRNASSSDRDDDRERERRLVCARTFVVFNREQIDGLDDAQETGTNATTDVDRWLASRGASIVHRGTRAFYAPDADRITMPSRARFADHAAYRATLIHELIHWTGHRDRLARTFGRSRNEPAYAREELVAEIGAAFLCAEFDVRGDLRHAGYLKFWLRELRAQPSMLASVAGAASRAVKFLHAQDAQAAALAS